MKQYLINNNSDELLLFFTGWGCDEYNFDHLKSSSNVLILYDYCDLNLDFDFSEYKKINLLAFSAGVMIASFFDFKFVINKKIALSGNPYLFDRILGLSEENENVLNNITEENADEFARNYLIKTDEEYSALHTSKRSFSSCKKEFECLKQIYENKNQEIKDIYDIVIFGEDDPLFNKDAQKEFYGNKLHYLKNTRHNLFYKFKSFEDILNFR